MIARDQQGRIDATTDAHGADSSPKGRQVEMARRSRRATGRHENSQLPWSPLHKAPALFSSRCLDDGAHRDGARQVNAPRTMIRDADTSPGHDLAEAKIADTSQKAAVVSRFGCPCRGTIARRCATPRRGG